MPKTIYKDAILSGDSLHSRMAAPSYTFGTAAHKALDRAAKGNTARVADRQAKNAHTGCVAATWAEQEAAA